MGDKGARKTSAAAPAAEALVEDLAGLSGAAVTCKSMFGGHGVFGDGVMFAIIDSEGTTYLRTGPQNEAAYEVAGSAEHDRMPYHEIPPNVRANQGELRAWAAESLAIARASTKK